jgi:hypothetical protein
LRRLGPVGTLTAEGTRRAQAGKLLSTDDFLLTPEPAQGGAEPDSDSNENVAAWFSEEGVPVALGVCVDGAYKVRRGFNFAGGSSAG